MNGLLIAAGYIFCLALTAWLIRFTRWYHWIDNDINPLPVFAVIFWPITWIVYLPAALVVAIAHTKFLKNLDWIVSYLTRREIQRDAFGVLYSMRHPHLSRDGDMRVVKVQDSTGTYWLPVPPTMSTAKEAVAWTYGQPPDDFNPVRV